MSRNDWMKDIKIMSAEYTIRVAHWIRVLQEELYEPLGEIHWEACRTMDQLTVGEALQRSFVPVEPGYTWGNTWEYCWFKGKVTLPEAAAGKRIVLNLKPGGESNLFVNGAAFGTYRSERLESMTEPHHFMVDNYITRAGVPGESYDIMMETYAGHYYPEAGGDCGAYGPVIDGMYGDSLQEGARVTLGTCTYGIWNEDAYQLWMDVKTLLALLRTMDQTTLRAAKIAEALEQFTMIVDFEQDKEARNRTYKEALAMLRPVMEAENGSTMPTFYAVGHAHLDLAWLWPFAETERKTARTFAAQLRLIDEYPDYKFIQSQPAGYEMCRKHYPELFERIKEAVKKGQWIADGGMWVEPDTNLAGGEALIRQILYGKKYYKEVFDVDSQVLWLPDTFGYTAALPQILNGCGMKYLVTQKIFWSYNDDDRFPYHYFNWEGMDGSRIVSFLPTNYNYHMDPMELNTVWKNRCQSRDIESFFIPFGYGDGGGGPARDYVEYAVRQKNLEGSVKVKMSSPREFFEERQEKEGMPKNTYTGELYFSAHRGTYTTQANTKKNNRKTELALRDMELWAAIASLNGGTYPAADAEELWKEALLYQFHDILPGSSIARVYEEVEVGYKALQEKTGQLCDQACDALVNENAEAVTVFNSLGFERTAPVAVPECFSAGAVLTDGTVLPVYQSKDGYKAYVTIPSFGAVSLTPAKETVEKEAAVSVKECEDGFVLENALVKAVVDRRGEVTSFVLKESGREFAAGKMNQLRMFKDVPRFFDAWDIDSHYVDQEMDGAFDISVEAVKDEAEAVLKVTGKIHESSYTQYLRLAKDSKRLVVDMEIDWNEIHKLLKVGFPADIYTENAIHEMQFGYVERPTHRSTRYAKDRYEVPNHRYTAICDGAHGAAVLNDCKYGISVNGNSMELTLLRAAASPAMRADNGHHSFTYAFTAWEGTYMDSDVVQQGYELNVQPKVVPGGALDMSFMSVDKANVIIDSMKLAEDGSGDVILRLYEAKKAAVAANVKVNLDGFKAYECDMLENIVSDVEVSENEMKLSFRAFEIKTVRLAKK